ncbi:hypothetical protein Tco_1187336 [Tanacetum coccineum]
MAAVSNIPELVDKKGGNHTAVAPRLEPGKFNKWKKRMLCYLMGMEHYYIQCIKDGPFKLKIVKDDIIESVISCETTKDTWTDSVHRFEGPSDTKENRIMDLKLEYQNFREKSSDSLLQTYTCYKTLLNELANDGVTLIKHEINFGFVNNLLEKWLSFSQGFRNANHTQIVDLADIYGRFVYEDNLIYRRYYDTKRPSFLTTLCSIFKKILMMRLMRDLDEEEVSDEEEEIRVQVLMALSDDELSMGKNHAHNG